MLEFTIYEPISAYSFAGSAEGVRQAMRAAGSKGLHLRVHSPGGDPFEAVAMRAQLASYPGPLQITVDGLAASAATILLTAPGADVRASEGSMIMIHNSAALADGGAGAMESAAAMLRAIDGTMARLYADATGKGLEEITAAMTAETWLTAEEALAFGLVGSLVERPQVEASVKGFNLQMFRKTPAALAEKGCQGGLQENMCYDSPMDLEIRKRLGLPESATEAEVFAALDRVSARPAAPAAPAPAVDANALAQLVQDRVQAALATHEASAMHRDAVQAAVERFISEGKIAPAGRDRAVALCGSTAESLNAAVAYWTSIDPIVQTASTQDVPAASKVSARARRWAAGAGVKPEYLEEAAK